MKNLIIFTVLYAQVFYRKLTAGRRTLPQFYILGAPKCGTTALYELLRQHPNFVSSFLEIKELSYLQEVPNFNPFPFIIHKVFGRYSGINSYRKFFPLKSKMASISKRTGASAVSGDCTPIYMYCPVAAKRVKALTPEAKLIIMIRNPISRTYSEYNMFREKKIEQRTFEQAIEDELKNISLSHFIRETYIQRSIYEPYIKMYYDLFDKKQIMVIKSEDFFSNTENVVKKVLEFIGLPQETFSVNYNTTPRNEGASTLPMKAETKNLLKNYFRPHNKNLCNLLGVDLNWDH